MLRERVPTQFVDTAKPQFKQLVRVDTRSLWISMEVVRLTPLIFKLSAFKLGCVLPPVSKASLSTGVVAFPGSNRLVSQMAGTRSA